MNTPSSELRRRVLNGKELAPHTKHQISNTTSFPLTDRMKLLEEKYRVPITIILSQTLNESVSTFGGEVNRSTISKWRKAISKHMKGEH